MTTCLRPGRPHPPPARTGPWSQASSQAHRSAALPSPCLVCYHCAYIALVEKIVEVAIRKMGNSQGVLIPKPILAQVGLEGTAELRVRDGVIEIRPVRRNQREGWAEDAQRLAEQGEDALVWPEVANEGDDQLVW